ncbi:MAG: Tad domain-containing protein [Bryobacteraceae bacterium]
MRSRKRFGSNERGAMLIPFSLMFMASLIIAGLAMDTGYMEYQRRLLQNATDAASLGALCEKQRGKTDWVQAGTSDAALNGFTNGVNSVAVNIQNPPPAGNYNGITTAIQASITKTQPTFFMPLVNINSVNLATAAVSQPGQNTTYCMYALNGTNSRTWQMSGSANIGCGIMINSSSSSALNLDGGSSLKASSINIVGNYTNSGTISPTPKTGVSAVSDPLASTASPSFSSCTYTNWQMNSGTGSKTLSPGTYCGGITISAQNLTATFNPGLYIVTGGINWNAQSNIVGSGVTFFFTKGGGSQYGQVTISGQVKVNLSAPTTTANGGIPGILMFGDRSWISTSQNVNINGASFAKLEGILYFPYTGMIITGQTSTTGNYLGIVADNITVNGGASLVAPAPNYSAVSGGSPFKAGVTLAQ